MKALTRIPLLLIALTALLLLVGCLPEVIVVTQEVPVYVGEATAEANADEPTDADELQFIFVQHGLCFWDSFWCVVEQGIYEAGITYDVNIRLLGPIEFDLDEVARLLNEAVDARPDGIAVTLPDLERMREPLNRAIEAGIPVLVYNSGNGPREDDIPYLSYIGQDEYEAGFQAGLRLSAEGGTRAVCVNQQPGNASLDRRCDGFEDALLTRGIPLDRLNTNDDPTIVVADITAYFQTSTTTDIVLTLGPNPARAYYQFAQDFGLDTSAVRHGTFDLSEEVVTSIRSGVTAFAIDQQPYLQGFLAVQWLVWVNRYGLTPAGPITPTGPGFIDRNNLELVQSLAGSYR